MNLEDCLPDALRGPATVISRIAAGFSGAGVYRVEAAGQTFVLKISDQSEPADEWRRKVEIQQRAADAGVAPAVLHLDETRRARLTPFVEDRSFFALYSSPHTRDTAIVLLAQTLRRLHAIAPPTRAPIADPLVFLA